MPSMPTLTIYLPPDTARRVREEAGQLGQDPADFALALIEAGLATRRDPAWQQRLDGVLAEFRLGVSEVGAAGEDVSPDAIEAAISDASEAARQERLARDRCWRGGGR
jgi:hypothetical protein